MRRNYKREYAQFQGKPKQRRYRAKLNQEARKRGIYGKRKAMGKDLSHTSSGKMVLESSSKNRSRNGKNGGSTLKKMGRRMYNKGRKVIGKGRKMYRKYMK